MKLYTLYLRLLVKKQYKGETDQALCSVLYFLLHTVVLFFEVKKTKNKTWTISKVFLLNSISYHDLSLLQ